MLDIYGTPSSRTSTLVIDDIQFDNCAHPSSLVACGPNQMMCPTTGVCIDRNTLCDTRNDCGDRWDESVDNCQNLTAMVCTFEKELPIDNCQFTVESDSNPILLWKVVNAAFRQNDYNVPRMTGPLIDHTYRLPNK